MIFLPVSYGTIFGTIFTCGCVNGSRISRQSKLVVFWQRVKLVFKTYGLVDIHSIQNIAVLSLAYCSMLKRKHPFTITHDSEPLLKIRILQQELSHSVESGIRLLNVSSKKRKREEETEFAMSCKGTKGSGDGPGKRMKSPEVSVSENKPVKVCKCIF